MKNKKTIKSKSTNKTKSKSTNKASFASIFGKKNKKALSLITVLLFALTGALILRHSFAAESWQLYWADEFNGTSLDTTSWKPYHSTYGDGNQEEACLTPNNVTVSSGTLKITSKREPISCPGKPQDQFSSGFIGSREVGKYYPKYAKYEMRAKVPHAQGLWPAFWLRHKNGSSTAEVDVMEYFHTQVPGKTTATIHLDNTKNVAKKTINFEYPSAAPSWHTWAVEIQPDPNDSSKARFNFLMDGNNYFSVTPSQQNWASQVDVNNMFDIAINTAVGGTYSGHPDDPLGWSRYLNACLKPYKGNQPCDSTGVNRAQFPMNYEIDYVRVYTKQTTSDPAPTPTPVPTPAPTPTPEPTPAPVNQLNTVSNVSSSAGDKKLIIRWDNVEGADNYTVRWGVNGEWSNYSNDNGANPTTNSYIINGLSNGTTYNVSVAARDTTGANTKGDYSQPISGTPIAPIAPTPTPTPEPTPAPVPAPQDTSAPTTPASLTRALQPSWVNFRYKLVLNWSPSSDNVGVVNYQISRNGSIIGTTDTTSFADDNIAANNKYEYKVVAKDAAGNTSKPATTTAKGKCFFIWCSLE